MCPMYALTSVLRSHSMDQAHAAEAAEPRRAKMCFVSRRRADGTVPLGASFVFKDMVVVEGHDRDWWGVAPHQSVARPGPSGSGPDAPFSYLARTNLHFYIRRPQCRNFNR